VLSTKHH